MLRASRSPSANSAPPARSERESTSAACRCSGDEVDVAAAQRQRRPARARSACRRSRPAGPGRAPCGGSRRAAARPSGRSTRGRGCDDVQQLEHDRRHAAEVRRPARALEALRQPLDADVRAEAVRVHLLRRTARTRRRRPPPRAAPGRAPRRAGSVRGLRSAPNCVGLTKIVTTTCALSRARRADEREVPLVQVAHRRHEADVAARLRAPRAELQRSCGRPARHGLGVETERVAAAGSRRCRPAAARRAPPGPS